MAKRPRGIRSSTSTILRIEIVKDHMANERNQFDLDRDIPANVAREVRQRCGFGCVICGAALTHYDHTLPEFSEAQSHDPKGIVLLCGGHHDPVTRGTLSREAVLEAAAAPKALQEGFSHGAFDIGRQPLPIKIGDVHAINISTLIRVMGEPILAIDPPELNGSPFLLSASFTDSAGTETLSVDRNQWKVPSATWDCEVTGKDIIVRPRAREIALSLRVVPRQEIVITKLNIAHRGFKMRLYAGKLEITMPDGHKEKTTCMTFSNGNAAIDVTEHGISYGDCDDVHIESLQITPPTAQWKKKGR